ncbi:MAG: type II toxin-antitoxin system HicB family antitoxin [Clostridiales bacterium]|nr:type II toxin-antitoxin system HicB family antitoxin [Clostridiales bacterium]
MRKLTYWAVFEPSSGGFSVYFPDLPGCISFGADLENAKKMATEALELHIYGMEKDGDPILTPSQNPEIDPETSKGYIISAITIFPDIIRNELDNRAVKTNLTLPAWLKELAEKEKVNYSKVLQAALMEYLGVNSPHYSVKK